MIKLKDIKVSTFTRFSTNAFLAITPEYWKLRKIQKKNQASEPSFTEPEKMSLSYEVIDGVKVRYAHEGEKDKPSIVLLNPLPQSIIAFAPIWRKLVSKYNVYAYDLPGFGMSEGGIEYMTFQKQGEFLDKFIKHFKIKKPHIVGPDIGMAAALYYASNIPNDIESLIIGDGPGVSPSINGSIINKLVNSAFWRKAFSILGSKIFVFAGANVGYVNYYPNQIEINDYIASYKNRVGTVTEWFKNYPEGLSAIDNKVEEIDAPVLIFWGDQDTFLLPENSDNLRKRLKRNKVVIFEHCGHFSYQDKHEAFCEMIESWISVEYIICDLNNAK